MRQRSLVPITTRVSLVMLGVLLVGTLGCSRTYRVHHALGGEMPAPQRIAIVPTYTEVMHRGLGSLIAAEGNEEEFLRDSLTKGAVEALREIGIEGVVMLGPQALLSPVEQEELVFECDLERRKILADVDLQGGFTRYADYISRPHLDSLASETLSRRATELGVSGFLLIKTNATSLSGLEYVREVIRGAVITVFSIFLDTTIAHHSYMSGDVMLLDAHSGAALFYNSIANFSGEPQKAEDSVQYIHELLQPLKERLEYNPG